MVKLRKGVIAALALSFALSAVMSACGESKETATSAQANSSEVQSASAAPEVKGKVTLVTNAPEYKAVSDKFKKDYPDIELVWDQQSTANFQDVYKTRLAAGDGIDVLTPQKADYPVLGTSGQLVDITDKAFLNNYTDGVIDSAKVNGKVYGVPLTAQVYLVWYNKDIFKKYSLSEPKDMDDFMNICTTLKKNSVTPMVAFGKSSSFNVQIGFFYHSLLSSDPKWLSKLTTGEAKWTDEGSMNAMKRFADFVSKGYILDGSLSLDDTQAYQAFYQGKAAMIPNGAWSIDKISQAAPSFEVGAFPYLSDKGVENKAEYTPGTTLAVAAQSKNKEAAMKYVEWISNKDNEQLWCNEAKQFGTVKGVSSDFHPVAKQLAPIYAMPKTPMFHAYLSPNAGKVTYVEFEKLLAVKETKATPESAANSIQTQQNKDVKK